MIPEGSCDKEGWRNNDENSALPSQEKITFKNFLKTANTFHKITVLLYF